ncbi:MAG: superoxide dismutase [Candidatus Eremiobacteraeota bacterium]|nr:superoxide dismutase [Candidatus Eremiobacteraeota bacterium]
MPFQVPPLPYGYDALEPFIDEQTMTLHHDKHHATYVTNLNAALANYPDLAGMNAEAILRDLNRVPEDVRSAVRNNGGGHVNHSMLWQIMGPNHGAAPSGPVAEGITRAFGDFTTFKKRFNEAGTKQFGSGWVWLVRSKDGNLEIITTPNQDNPISQGHHPILGNDVWEHAYYLKYNNRRADYLEAWWNVVRWDHVNERFNTGG